MRVLLINQFFWPDLAPTGQLAADLARHLVKEGHSVTVICSRAMYAPVASESLPGVRVIRRFGPGFSRWMPLRLLSYATFLLLAAWSALRAPRPDVVITLTTPPLLSLIGTLLKKTRGVRHLIWEMDVYPELAIELGYLRDRSPVTRMAIAAARFVRQQSDGVLALGECMRERLIASGVAAEKIQVVENWADGNRITPIAHAAGRSVNILYSGNLGMVHEVDTVRLAIAQLRTDQRFHFTFVGSGARTAGLEEYCRVEGCRNVSFLPYQSRDRLNETLGSGDIGLVTQQSRSTGLTVPSKTYSLMAAGRPILFIGPREATTSRIIERYGCGWQIDCGDVPRLLRVLDTIFENRHLLSEAGAAAREAFMTFYDLPLGVSRIGRILEFRPLPNPSGSAADNVTPVS